MKRIIVFDDGETWSEGTNACIYELSDDQFETVQDGVKPRTIPGVIKIPLPEFDGNFGREAEELRQGIEELIEEYAPTHEEGNDPDLEGIREGLQKLLNEGVAARDSLYFCGRNMKKRDSLKELGDELNAMDADAFDAFKERLLAGAPRKAPKKRKIRPTCYVSKEALALLKTAEGRTVMELADSKKGELTVPLYAKPIKATPEVQRTPVYSEQTLKQQALVEAASNALALQEAKPIYAPNRAQALEYMMLRQKKLQEVSQNANGTSYFELPDWVKNEITFAFEEGRKSVLGDLDDGNEK